MNMNNPSLQATAANGWAPYQRLGADITAESFVRAVRELNEIASGLSKMGWEVTLNILLPDLAEESPKVAYTLARSA